MKKFILLFIFSTYSLCEVISPSWYPKYTNTHNFYAYAPTLLEAKNNIVIQIKEKLNISDVSNDDFVILKKELFENKIFIKTLYVNQSIENQLINHIKSYAFKQEEYKGKSNNNTFFFKKIYDTFLYQPNIKIVDRFVYFKDNKFLIKNNELPLFYNEYFDKNITINVQNEIKENESFFIKVQTSYEDYITLARVYKRKFSILFKNKKINKSVLFPNFKVSDGLKMKLSNAYISQNIFYVAISCKQEKEFFGYNSYLDDSNMTNLKNLDDFVQENKDCKITSKTSKLVK